MESCNDKYCNSWNNDLYIYSRYRSVCHYRNNGYCDNYFDHPDIYTDRAALSEFNCSNSANQFDKYSGHNRDMESCNDKYCNSRNNNLYLYSCCRSVFHYHNNGCCDNYFYHTDIYADRTIMPELNCSGTASKFNKFSGHNRYMEPGNY